MSHPRNAPCHCGSGKKFKHCHGSPEAAQRWTPGKVGTLVVATAIACLLAWSGTRIAMSLARGELVPEGAIWSAEHGHWHDAQGREIGSPTAAASPGLPPAPGAVWSAEHGHWHGADGQEIRAGFDSLPPGAPPVPGAVWSAEHGHWHGADGQEIGRGGGGMDSLPPGAPPVVGATWSAEHGHWHDANGQAIQ